MIRALEPLAGIAIMQRRRPTAHRVEALASGPGKLTLALAITRKQNGADLTRGPLQVRHLRNEPSFEVEVTPRVGITHCADWPLRFLIKDNHFVSR